MRSVTRIAVRAGRAGIPADNQGSGGPSDRPSRQGAPHMRLPLRRTASAALIAVLPVLALALPAAPGAAEPRSGPPGAIPGRYIVTLKPGASPDTVLGGLGATPLFTYRHALIGFAAQLTQAQAE